MVTFFAKKFKLVSNFITKDLCVQWRTLHEILGGGGRVPGAS